MNIAVCDKILRPGIEPGPLAWKASMQPLTLTEQGFLILKIILFLIGNINSIFNRFVVGNNYKPSGTRAKTTSCGDRTHDLRIISTTL